MTLAHATDDCTGDWRLVGRVGARRFVECSRCGARYSATEEAMAAAREENTAGIYLRRLTREGAEP